MKQETKVGVALTKCYFCGEDDRIVLNSTLTEHHASKVEQAHGKVIDMEPCAKCQEWMKQGIILLTIDPAKSDPDWNRKPLPNPYRTGGFTVIKEEALKRILPPTMAQWAIKHRFMFIEHEAAEKLGIIKETDHE